MFKHEVTEDYYREILRIATGIDTKWDKKKKEYVDDKGASHGFITYNQLLEAVKRGMMAGTMLETNKMLHHNSTEVMVYYRALNHQSKEGGIMTVAEIDK